MAKPASIKDSYKSLKRLLSGEMGCSGQVIGFGFLLVMIGSTAAMVWFFYTGQHLLSDPCSSFRIPGSWFKDAPTNSHPPLCPCALCGGGVRVAG